MKIILISLIFVVAVFAQTDVGFTVGYNHSQYKTIGLEAMEIQSNPISGFELGLNLRYPISNRFSLLSEILIIRGGTDVNIGTEVGDLDFEIQSEYRVVSLTIPLQFSGRLFTTNKYDIEVFAGPYLSFPISGEYDFSSELIDSSSVVDITSYVSTDIGFSVGSGLYRNTSFGRFGLDLRFLMGFVSSGYPTYENLEEIPFTNLFTTVNLRWYPWIRQN